MRRVTHDGRETAYRRSDRGGDGPTICCIHGSGGTNAIWKAQSRLADRFPVVALDLSGHGGSEDVSTEPGLETLEAYADDVVAVSEEAGATVLCGNSLGGAVTQWVALERDLDLDGIVLAGTGAKLAVLEDLLAYLATDFDRALSFLHGADRLFHDAPQEYVDFSIDAMYECGRAITERDFLTCHRFDVRDRMADIDVPALAIVGEHDTLTPVSYHEYFAAELADCDRAIVAEAAHLAMMEQPTAFNAAVDAFVRRL